jgi:hypothetical protein
MQDVRPVDPKKEAIRKAVEFFHQQLLVAEKEKERVEAVLAAHQVLLAHAPDLVKPADIMLLRNDVRDAQWKIELAQRCCKALPDPCTGCGGRGVAGSGMGAHTCGFCHGVGYNEPGALRIRA